MTDVQATISDNLQRIRDRIAHAADAADRDVSEIKLVAVTKYVDADVTAALLAVGCNQLGESRPQQLWQKAESETLGSAKWHLIGHLQRNKVQRTVPLVDLIHSVDSERLLRAIDKAAADLNHPAQVLLEVNTSGDEEKHGLTPDGLKQLLEKSSDFPNVSVRGLMTMAAREGGTAVAGKNFAALRQLRDKCQKNCPDATRLDELSMGMSHDFEVAIREGATLVRIGSALFEGLR